MISTKLLLLAPVYSFSAVCSTFVAFTIGPDIQEHLFPVLTDQAVAEKWRTPELACWNWTYTKAQGLPLTRLTYVIERADGIRYPVTELRPDLGIQSNESTTAKQGVTRTIPKCVVVPPVLRTTKPITIIGHQFYRGWFWELDQPIVPVRFDFVPPDEPPRGDASVP